MKAASIPTAITRVFIALLLLAAHSAQAAPTVALNAPVMLLRGAKGQFAKVTPITEPGYTYSWSLSNGTITDGQGMDLVMFDVPTGVTQTILTITISNGVDSASASQTILLNAPGGDITDGTQTVTFGGTTRLQYSLLQQLRGERVSVTASPGVDCTLLDAQGRLYTAGAAIDFRVPVRGTCFLVLSAASSGSYTFTVTGARPPSNGGAVDSGSLTGTGNPAAQGQTTNVRTYNSMSCGEAMTISQGQVVSAIYDYALRRTRIVALPGSTSTQPGWEWTSTDDSYVRTLSTGKDGNIYGVGSGGGTGPAADTIYAFKLLPDGTLVWEVNLQTTGSFYDMATASSRMRAGGSSSAASPLAR